LQSWVAAAIGGEARVVAVQSLHSGEAPWLFAIEVRGRRTRVVVREPTRRISAGMIIVNAVALQTAMSHSLRAPELLGLDPEGETAGVTASIETVVPGTTGWPAPTTRERLEAAGEAIARVHGVQPASTRQLPYRPRPIAVDDFAADRRLGRMPTTALLRAADDHVLAARPDDNSVTFVHGDVWPGNMVWSGSSVQALIDWKTAGVGSPGVDLGELRKQVAIMYGADAPRHVLIGWERASGRRASDVAYWDAVAALNTPTRLYDETATAGRDAFLRAALNHWSGRRGLGRSRC
jgi:aminoglycoside phosphotransferase (APT) family kinase protein